MISVQLSYSRLSAFMSCGLLYRLRYVERIPARPKPHLGFGRILHSTLDKFYNLDTRHPTFDDLRRLYSGYWRTDSDAYKKHYAKGLSILKRYYELNVWSYDRAVYVEQPFEIPIGDHRLTGRFDRIDQISDDNYEIVDYKAARRVPPQAEVDADLQLGIYALAFKLTTGKLSLVSFYFLPENVKVTSHRTEAELHRLESGLHSIVDRMLSGEHFDPRGGIECKWCDYKRYCPLKTDTPLELPIRQVQPELEFSRSQRSASQ